MAFPHGLDTFWVSSPIQMIILEGLLMWVVNWMIGDGLELSQSFYIEEKAYEFKEKIDVAFGIDSKVIGPKK